MFIDGKFVDAKSGKKFETVNPANDEVIAAVALGDAEDIDRTVTSGRRAFKSGVWSRTDPVCAWR
jgi:acyl-CoA reductase-like NAD-dependent aldehyde dehydrogenase